MTTTNEKTPVSNDEAPSVGVPSGAWFGVWVPVTELPKAGRRVLVTALNGIHVWQTVAQYWPAGTMDASNWDDPPEDWWDEDGDKCTNPDPGWYESQIETETNYLLTGVTHWMPLPPSPNVKSEPRSYVARSVRSTIRDTYDRWLYCLVGLRSFFSKNYGIIAYTVAVVIQWIIVLWRW